MILGIQMILIYLKKIKIINKIYLISKIKKQIKIYNK
jgi:hypothetical protein